MLPSSSTVERRKAEHLGRAAEEQVASGWEARGYTILARRLRTGAGEIDLVLADRDTLIFMEVKARHSVAQAAYSVSPRQQARLLEAAGLALATHEHWHRSCTRFDVALVCHERIEHIEDAIRYQ
jgi:putative endonuclease